MAKRRTTPSELPDAVREAVDRTLQATAGSAERTRGTLDELVKGAEAGLTRSRKAVQGAVEERLPATQDDMRELRAELRRIATRLEEIEKRLGPPGAA